MLRSTTSTEVCGWHWVHCTKKILDLHCQATFVVVGCSGQCSSTSSLQCETKISLGEGRRTKWSHRLSCFLRRTKKGQKREKEREEACKRKRQRKCVLACLGAGVDLPAVNKYRIMMWERWSNNICKHFNDRDVEEVEEEEVEEEEVEVEEVGGEGMEEWAVV